MSGPRGFSIVIPVKEINAFVVEALPKILALKGYPFEVLVVPNEHPPFELSKSFEDPRVKVIASGRVSPAVKRDLAADQSSYCWLAFLDDDAYPREDWLQVAGRYLEQPNIHGVGGPGVTPPDNSVFQQASGLFFETLLGGGGMAYRYRPGRKTDFFVDDYPTVNLVVDKAAFQDIGGFDNRFWPGEDTKFCLDFVTRGYRIIYSRDLVVWHHRRAVLGGHLRQVGNYGKHRGYFAKRFPKTSARLVYFIPSLFFLGNILLLTLGLFSGPALALWVGMMALYWGIACFDVGYRTRNPALFALTVVTIFISHLFYGMMFLKGLLFTRSLESQLR